MNRIISIICLCLWINACAVNKKITKLKDFKTDYKFANAIENNLLTDTVPWKYQISAADYAIKGDYQNALKHWDLAFEPRPRKLTTHQIDSINKKYTKIKAIDYILDQAKLNKIIIINEAHHNSMHRAFTKSLLKSLYDQGYKNLGLEALGNGKYLDTSLQVRKYPSLSTGHYIKDPQFGNLVREALEIGYNIFAYEVSSDANGKLREIEQAKNIENFIKSNPNEKFLIHCGFDHVLEGPHSSWEKTMAGRVEEFTGINPFTINQVVLSEKSKPEFNPMLLQAMDIPHATVLLEHDQKPMKYEREKNWTDIAVLHPKTKYINNRPNWMFDKENKNVSVSLAALKINFPVMVLAYKKGENINTAIPYDILEVTAKTATCHLALKKGKYTIVTASNNQAFVFDIKVK